MQLMPSVLVVALAAGLTDARSLNHRSFFGNQKYARAVVDLENDILTEMDEVISPKAFIVSTFEAEAAPWKKYLNYTHNISLPGLSPLYPNISCTANHDICHLTTGESEANAAASITSLLLNPNFNVSSTYFLVAGIGGIDPKFGGLGSAAFARYAVATTMMYEVDARQKPDNWTSGYWAYGTNGPNQAPQAFYGSEVFELNEKLRDYAFGLALNVSLATSDDAKQTEQLYKLNNTRRGPRALMCDVSTSSIYPTGNLLGEAASNYTRLFTNGTGNYCITAQEDTAILEAALRGAKYGYTDFSRWVVLRTGADFDRPPVDMQNNTIGFFQNNNTGGFQIASENLYRAGYPFLKSVVQNWNKTFINGTNIFNGTYVVNGTHNITADQTQNSTYAPTNYIGDVLGSLGGKPDFGPGSYKEFAYVNF